MPQYPSLEKPRCRKQVLHNCDKKHHNHIQHFTCTLYLNMNVHVIHCGTERMEELLCDVIYKYNVIYKDLRHTDDTYTL